MSSNGIKEKFLPQSNELGTLINTKANELFFALKNFNVTSLGTIDSYNDYFIQHHLGKRLFFSIQNSAHILYQGISLCKKPINEINAIDYGAGLGTLFMLGGMLGFKRFDYNDYLPEWQATAKAVCKSVGISITNYVTGDINAVVHFAASKNFRYDLVVSRNVIEHIYNLPEFYSVICSHNLKAITYSTTTANYHNPAMHLYHIHIHKKSEKYYRKQRMEEIKKLYPTLHGEKFTRVCMLTRGKGQQDFIDAVNNFMAGEKIEPDSSLRSNTCDCINGVWSEHLLTKYEYEKIIQKAGFKMIYSAGYWDTHYSNIAMNFMANIFNKLMVALGKKSGITLAPFVNVATFN